MVFSSFSFLYVFLPLALATYYLVHPRVRNPALLVASYAFYGWWRVDFTLLLLVSTVVDYVCGLGIGRSESPGRKRIFLIVSVVFNLCLLGYFKYFNFGIENFNAMLAWLGSPPLRAAEVVLPVGISFITFQTMSYTIDVYRGVVKPTRNLLTFATYVSLFPQLVAGPIVRYSSIADQLEGRTHSADQFARGAYLFVIGFNKKVLLANNFGLAADEAFNHGPGGVAGAWLGLLAYTFQIYFDFSGYSDMAVGIGRMLGFEFPRNFDGPYRSQSITEFWRRWHITLSTWIRDYLYISLGGNRGSVSKTYRNLAISMLLAGLWHGANWTFIIWGGYHGSLLILERLSGRKPIYAKAPTAVRVALTWVLVMLGWLVFRSTDLDQFGSYLVALFNVSELGFQADSYVLTKGWFFGLTLVAFLLVFRGKDSMLMAEERRPRMIALQMGLFLVAGLELLSQGFNPFLYFQF